MSDVLQAIEDAPEFEPRPEAEELGSEPPTPEGFPLEKLGDLQPIVSAIHGQVQAPIALCAQSVLAGVNYAVQHLANIKLPMGDIRPISEFFLTVAESGERKSSADTRALNGVRQVERERSRRSNVQLKLYQKALRDGTDTESTQEPLATIMLVSEPTYEGLVNLLAVGWPSLGLFTEEGARFVGGYGMSPEQQLKTAGGMSELWDGVPISRVRVSSPAIQLHGRRVAVHIMIQPGASRGLISNDALWDQGLLARFLPVAPARTAGSRPFRLPSSLSIAVLEEYSVRIRQLLERPLPLAQDTRNELDPPVMLMSTEAIKLWIAFYDAVEQQSGEFSPLDEIRAFASKMPEHASRIGATLQLFHSPGALELTADWMSAGIAIVQYYANEWLRIKALDSWSVEEENAEKILRWLREKQYCDFHLTQITQGGPFSTRKADVARSALGLLEDRELVIRLDPDSIVDGKRRKDAWRFVEVES